MGCHAMGCVVPPAKAGKVRPRQYPILREQMSQTSSRDPRPLGRWEQEGPVVGALPSCLSVSSLVASSEGRARPLRGLPGTMRTLSLLFIRLYLFSDLLTN